MAFNISDIRTVITKYDGLSRKPYFYVILTPPKFLSSNYARDFSYLCTSVNLPGLHFDTVPIRPQGYGTPELRPYDTVTENLTCELLVDAKGEAFNFFQAWMGNINNFNIDRRTTSNATKLNYYEFAYPEEYESTLEIVVLNNVAGGNDIVTKYTINQAYPVNIGDISVNWNNENEINMMPITFAYNIWSSASLPFNGAMKDVAGDVSQLRNNTPGIVPTTAPTSTENAYNWSGYTPAKVIGRGDR